MSSNVTPRRPRRRVARAALAAIALLVLVPGTASAHPLGNFTINHYSGLRVEPDRVLVDHVIDYAEIPAFQERQAMDRAGDGDGTVSDAEAAAYRDAACARQASALELVFDGARVPLVPGAAAILFPPGQAGAPTLRLVCALTGTLPKRMCCAPVISFRDPTDAERLGWREIVVVGDRVTIALIPGTVLAESPSARLTAYPDDLLAEPLHTTSVRFDVSEGGPALAPFTPPELATIAGPAPSGGAGSAAPAGCEDATAALPGGTADFGREICELVQARDLTPAAILVSLFAAALIGAAHAVSPGHGKTVMAAYLVGARGGLRHAVGLGLTVTVSHTIGVLALGGLTIYAASFLPPDRLQLVLGVVSGLILVVLGSYLVLSRVRVGRRQRAVAATGSPLVGRRVAPALAHAGGSVGRAIDAAHGPDRPHEHGPADPREAEGGHEHPHQHTDPHQAERGHEHPHAHGDGHEHPHGADHAHEHGHGHEHPHDEAERHGHEHPAGEAVEGNGHAHEPAEDEADEAGGWHSHGVFRHTHLPEKLPDGGLSWRALFALGLSGGLVPSASAIIVLLVSISLGRPGYGIVLTIAFGLGMAVVLIGIGIALVYARGLLERMPRRSLLGGLMRYVPMATAVFVLVVGLAVTAQALSQVR